MRRARVSTPFLFLFVFRLVIKKRMSKSRSKNRSFALARCSHCRLLCLRVMPFSFHGISIAPVIVALLLICSCEKHRVGEMPDAQTEHVDLAAQPAKTSSASPEGSASPSPALTPAEFFPERTPP